MNTTVPADPRLRKRAIAVVSITLLVGLVFLSFFQGFLREMEALATASPQLAFEKLKPVRNAALGCHSFFCDGVSVLAGLRCPSACIALGSGRPLDGVSCGICRFAPDDRRQW